MTQFSSNLRSKRLGLGWSQEKAAMEISIACGKRIDKTTYRSWELGRRVRYELDVLVKIAEVLKIDDLYLFITSKELIS